MKSGRGFKILVVLLTGLCLLMLVGLTDSKRPDDNSPENVTGLIYNTGNFWINWSWNPSLNADDYDVWISGSDTGMDVPGLFYNTSCPPHASSTISVRAHNHTPPRSYSNWSNQTTQLPDNPVAITSITPNAIVDRGQTVYVDANYLDADGDTPIFYCNRTDLFIDFNAITGQGNWTASDTGVHYIDFGVSDVYGSIDNTTMIITVLDTTPLPGITGLSGTTGNFWINWTWTNPSDTGFSHVMIYINGNWKMNTSNNFYNETFWAHAIQTISTRTVDIKGNINTEWVNQTTSIPDNPITILDVPGSISVEKGQTVQIDVNCSDEDSDIHAFYCNRTDLFTDFNVATGTGNWMVNETGVYSIDFGVSDGYGSTDNSTSLVYVQYTLPYTTPPVTSPQPQGEGAAVGGGGIVLGEPFENVADKEVQYISTVSPGSDIIVEFKKPVHHILEVKFVYSQAVSEISVTVEKLINSSMLANSSPEGVIYENDNIWVNVPNPAYISNATIKFRVEKIWIFSNQIDPESIALFRFKDGGWNILPIDKQFENETMIIYKAATPGFSPFTIAGKKTMVSSPQPTSEPTISPAFSPADTPISGAASMPPVKPAIADDNSEVLSYIFTAVLVGGLMGFGVVTFLYYYTKPKAQS